VLAASAYIEQTSTVNLICWLNGHSLSCKAARQRGHKTAAVAFALLCTQSTSLYLVAEAQAWHSQLEGKQGAGSLFVN